MIKRKEYLQYKFSDEEISEMSKDLAYKSKELEQLESAKKSLTAEFNSKIQSAKTEISRLANNINNGFDFREIECEVIYDEPTEGLKTIKRLDTNQVISIEKMTPDEMQRDIFEEEI